MYYNDIKEDIVFEMRIDNGDFGTFSKFSTESLCLHILDFLNSNTFGNFGLRKFLVLMDLPAHYCMIKTLTYWF